MLPADGAAAKHNSDYAKYAPSVSREFLCVELPGESVAGKQPPSGTSGLKARQGAAHFQQTRFAGSDVPLTFLSVLMLALAFSLDDARGTCHLRQLPLQGLPVIEGRQSRDAVQPTFNAVQPR